MQMGGIASSHEKFGRGKVPGYEWIEWEYRDYNEMLVDHTK